MVTVIPPLFVVVVVDPVSEVEQAVTVEQESVMVEVDCVVAPDGVKTDNEVSQALFVCAEQELLELLELLDFDPVLSGAVLVGEEDFFSSSSCISLAISSKVSVKFSTKSTSGVGFFTSSAKFLTTLVAQPISLETSSTAPVSAPVMLPIILLS